MSVALAIRFIKFCLALQGLLELLIQTVRGQHNAADLLAIDTACGIYSAAQTVKEKTDAAEQIRDTFDN